jgi:C4-dicarboxylate-specific signal transduction histidine kinase
MYAASQTDLKQRLQQVEGALEQCQRMALASSFAGAVMHEVNNPLEAITNLVYLTKTRKDDLAFFSENMDIVEQQLAILSKVTSQALTFHRTQAEAQDWDLVAIA